MDYILQTHRMFTGIITSLGTLRSRTRQPQADTRFVIDTDYPTDSITLGASIACSGACMTVVEKGEGWFAVDVSDESLRCTHMDSWEQGRKINLERSLKMGDELGGHIVTGHVDGLAVIRQITSVEGSHCLTLEAPKDLAPFIAAKGSVTLDGVSLTVNTVEDTRFTLNLIPHTWQHTTFHLNKEGDRVHLEIDILARYVARMLSQRIS
jgi:riboflavin synthase